MLFNIKKRKEVTFFNYILLFLLLTFSFFDSFAQEYLFEVDVLNVKDGLPEREVYDIVVDKKGYLWISTQGAISRYDGHKFKTYTYQQLKIDEYQPAFLRVDDRNNIWYVESLSFNEYNYSGVINTRNDSVYSLEEYTNGLFNSRDILNLNDAYEDASLRYLTTHEGIIYEYKNGSFKKVYAINNTDKSHIYYEPNGKEENWMFYANRAIRVQDNQLIDTFIFKEPHIHLIKSNSQQSSLIVESYDTKDSSIFWQFRDTQFIPYQTAGILPTNIIQLEQDFNTYLIDDTLVIRDDKERVLFQYRNPIGEEPQHSYYLKRQQILFIGTANGLIKITRRKKPFQLFYEDHSIRGLYHEKDYLWVGGERINKRIHLPTGKEEHLFSDSLKNPFIAFTSSFKDSNNQLWMGTNFCTLVKGLPNEQQHIYTIDKYNGTLSTPFENKQTKKIWIGTTAGLAYIDKSTNQIHPIELPNKWTNFNVRHFHQNEKGIWILTNKGILLMDATSETILNYYTDDFPHTNFNHLHEDADGVFWLATKGGGLIRWDISKNTIKQFTQEQGLSHNVLYAVYEDDYENLWLPSDYGLMQFNKNTTTIRVYLPSNGIPHEEFNAFSHTQTTDGTLYFGGLNGVVGFHPKTIQKEITNFKAPLHLSSVKVLEADNQFRDIPLESIQNNTIELNYDYQLLKLELSFLDYESPEDNQYAYQIEGYQDQWIYSKENILSIFKLPYGKYRIKLKAKGGSGVWSYQIITLPLSVSPPFYLQFWFIILLFFLFITSVILFIRSREVNLQKDKERLEQEVKKRTETITTQTEKLKQLDKAKTRFFSNITHEFRTPLTLVIGSLQQMIKAPAKEVTFKRLMGVLKDAQQILYLINQLLDISKLEGGKMKVEIHHGNIISYTYELVEGFKELARRKNQRLVFHAKSANWETHFDKDKWNKIIYNVLFNAIKFTPQGGAIQLSLSKIIKQQQEWIQLKIRDTGIGLKESQLSKIFNRFYQTDDSSTRHQEGTGIGLALVKELVELQQGEIWVTSKVNRGTTFDIQIPIPTGIFKNVDEAIIESEDLPIPVLIQDKPLESLTIEKSLKQQDLKILLIEDNKEMLRYTQSCLEGEKYNIITAIDGEEGTQKAFTLIPDLVVSDVMMPIKDGFEVTQAIRQNIATSHIPIILLTAKASLESKLEGLERGADAYLTKPFSPEELNLRIQKLIENRQLLQNRYQNGTSNNIFEKNQYKKEDVFISNLKKHILKHLEDTNLNGESIAKAFGISRMQLHRKIKALTNQTTTSFLYTVRLEVAYKYLEEQNLNISEIAYRTGFKTPNHFTRIFKQKYGKAPSLIRGS